MIQLPFKRDDQGNLSDTGIYSNNLLSRTSYKYLEQRQFSFGVAKAQRIGENLPEGVRMEEFDHTGKHICTIDVLNSHIKIELKVVVNSMANLFLFRAHTYSHYSSKSNNSTCLRIIIYIYYVIQLAV